MKKRISKAALALVLAICMMLQGMSIISVSAAEPPSTEINNLQVEYTTNPIGLDTDSIHFGWQMDNLTQRGQSQTAYQIMVASSKENLDAGNYDMWDSGKIDSTISVAIPYEGKTLEATHRYFWKVTVWDENDQPITSTEEAYFETSLLDSGWDNAQWIGKTNEDPNAAITKFTVDFDFIIDSDNAGIAFGAKDSSNLFMWQVNTYDFKADNAVYLRPHIKQNGAWTVLPPSSNGSGPEENISDKIGYTAESIIGQKVHMQIAVDNGVVNTYFDGSKESVMTYNYGSAIPVGKIAFRHNTDNNATEIARYDNFVVKDGEGNVLFEDDFSDASNPNFTGGTIEDGMLKVGSETKGETIVLQKDAVEGNSAPMLRKDFSTTEGKEIASARVYATSAGIYELYLNGEKVGKDYFNPGWTDYTKHTMYQTFDVTDMMNQGENTFAAMLGKGWYCGNITHVGPNRYGTEPALMAKLVVEYADGTEKTTIVTDDTWSFNGNGPIVDNNFLDGEKYDATKEIDGWDNVGFQEDDTWSKAGVYDVNKLGIGPLDAQIGETVQQVDTLTVKEVTEPKENAFIYDLGQNFAGVIQLNLPGEFTKANKGLKITLRHGEMLNDDSGTGDDVEGSLYDANLRTFKAIDTYTIKGDENGEIYTPRFTFHGFRYVEITGIEEALPAEWVTGIVLSNALEVTGDIETSNALVNQLYSNVLWGQRSNFISIPTDCPQRNERMGWTGDAQIFTRTATYLKNSDQFYNKYMYDVRTSQRSDGAYPNVAPALKVYESYYNNGWGDAGLIIPWQMYQQYGDTQIIKDNYDGMKAWVDLLYNTTNGTYLRPAEGLGDWLNVQGTDTGLTNSAFFVYSSELMSKMAAVVDNEKDSTYYGDMAQKAKEAWKNKYQNEDGTLKENTQTACLVALEFDIVEDEADRAVIAKQLVDNIRANDNHLTVGFVGVSYLCPVLSEMGYDDVAYTLLQQETYPSWLYSVNQGATTIWERWNSYTKENGFGDVSMNSFNHYSFGSIAEWMYRYMLGIERDETAPSYKHFILQPAFGGTITSANGYFDTVYGRINSSWTLEDNAFHYQATVPANTTATLYLPAEKTTAVYESGKDITKEAVDGITYIGTENGEAIFELESGSYNFSSSVVNKSGLEEAISKGSTFGEFFYTPDSFKPLQDALAKAEEVQANKDATATEIQDAINAIETAIAGLVPIGQDGTESNPYQINDIDDITLFANTVNSGSSFEGKYVELTTDLDLSGIDWMPIGTESSMTTGDGFAGVFNGNGHVISNVNITDSSEYATFGLFGTISGTVRNLGVENVTVNSGSVDCRSGGFAGTLTTGGFIDNCYVVNANVTATSRVAAGFVGQSYNGTIQNSYVKDVVTSGGRTGGFVGDNSYSGANKGTIRNCYANASLTSSTETGIVENSKVVTDEQFTNGEVVEWLNQGNTETVWEQGETHPTLVVTETPDPGDPLKELLGKTIDKAEALKGTDEYENAIPMVKESFDAALETAKEVYADVDATRQEVLDAFNTLMQEIHKLGWYTPDKSALQKLYEELKDTNLDQYVDGAAKDNFKTALEQAKKVLDDENALQGEVDKAAQDLQNAYDALVKLGDKTQLKKLLDICETYEEKDYIAETWKVFVPVWESAKAVYDNANASQEEVDKAVDELTAAMLQLRLQRGDKTALQELYNAVKDTNLDEYVDGAAKDNFVAALEQAKNVLDDDNAVQSVIDKAYNDLYNAYSALEKLPDADKSQLEKLLNECETYEESNYTPETWEVFAPEWEAAKQVFANEKASQEQINEAIDNLIAAMLQLRYKADKSLLETAVAIASAKEEAAYTAEGYSVLKAAVAEANAVIEDENADQEEVDAATKSVKAAIEGLVAVGDQITGTGTGQTTTTTKNPAKTGDFAPIAGVVVLALAGVATIALKKRK